MHDELFAMRAVVARYRAGLYVEARERFLQQASADQGRTCKTSGSWSRRPKVVEFLCSL